MLIASVMFSGSCADLTRHYHWFLDMRNSPAVDTQQLDSIKGRVGNMLPPEGSVAYKEMPYEYSVAETKLAEKELRVPANLDIKDGEYKYNIYCAPCHGMKGYGDGPVKTKGKWGAIRALVGKNKPAASESYPMTKLYHIATQGFGTMSGYSSQISDQSRWNLVAYIKNVLQKKK